MLPDGNGGGDRAGSGSDDEHVYDVDGGQLAPHLSHYDGEQPLLFRRNHPYGLNLASGLAGWDGDMVAGGGVYEHEASLRQV